MHDGWGMCEQHGSARVMQTGVADSVVDVACLDEIQTQVACRSCTRRATTTALVRKRKMSADCKAAEKCEGNPSRLVDKPRTTHWARNVLVREENCRQPSRTTNLHDFSLGQHVGCVATFWVTRIITSHACANCDNGRNGFEFSFSRLNSDTSFLRHQLECFICWERGGGRGGAVFSVANHKCHDKTLRWNNAEQTQRRFFTRRMEVSTFFTVSVWRGEGEVAMMKDL